MLDRIKKIIEIKQINATQFADEIGVQRSALSHVLSGRNNPSLDFMLKIKSAYPEISLDWLLIGSGTMIENASAGKATSSKPDELAFELDFPTKSASEERQDTIQNKSNTKEKPVDLASSKTKDQSGKTVKQIVFLFDDNTFQVFENL